MSTPVIRVYDPKCDYEGGLDVFFKTINPALDNSPTRGIGSYLWYIPYVTLTPSTCLVLDSGALSPSTFPRPSARPSTAARPTRSSATSSSIVGYILGTPATAEFSQQWRDVFVPTVPQTVVPTMHGKRSCMRAAYTPENTKFRAAVYDGACSQLLAFPDVLAQYPAHLHIDILPEYQGQGWGRKLVEAWCELMMKKGACGVHLDMAKDNEGAKKFYEKLGFEACGEVLDGGESGEKGISGDGAVLTMVKKL